jgi:hypothetical protein
MTISRHGKIAAEQARKLAIAASGETVTYACASSATAVARTGHNVAVRIVAVP